MTDAHDHARSQLRGDLNAMTTRAFDRRQALRWLAGAALIPLVPKVLGACETAPLDDDDTTGGSCNAIPEETGGPYPADGTNGPNVLALDGIVRSDIRSSIGDLSGTAAGIPLTITLTITDALKSCAALAGAAVYLWHCDRDGHYSLYTIADQNYLRGVQVTDSAGKVTFTSIFPACYSGRWPHIHFEVYASLAEATGGGDPLATSQIALPATACDAVFATAGYGQSVTSFAQISLASDNVFSDGATLETPTISGDVASGFAIAMTAAV